MKKLFAAVIGLMFLALAVFAPSASASSYIPSAFNAYSQDFFITNEGIQLVSGETWQAGDVINLSYSHYNSGGGYSTYRTVGVNVTPSSSTLITWVNLGIIYPLYPESVAISTGGVVHRTNTWGGTYRQIEIAGPTDPAFAWNVNSNAALVCINGSVHQATWVNNLSTTWQNITVAQEGRSKFTVESGTAQYKTKDLGVTSAPAGSVDLTFIKWSAPNTAFPNGVFNSTTVTKSYAALTC